MARRRTLLVVGCGDVGLRVLQQLQAGPARAKAWRVLALTSSPGRMAALRQAGAQPVPGNLDRPESLRRLAGLAQAVLHLAPPPAVGAQDPRTRHLLQALRRGTAPQAAVYGSTTGVYGDAAGAWLDETRTLAPATDRARRRVAAESLWRSAAHRRPGCVLRIPGIYALDREGGDPRDRVRRGAPVLAPQEDVYTNHIHAEDLAQACLAALWRGRPGRVYHVCDDSQRRMGEHFEVVAQACGLPPPPRLTRAQARERLSPVQLSFWAESRRLRNRRLVQELGVRLRYPDVLDALREAQD
ncbi:SDR family oxidoreductase [Ideonella livida]|nr:SDR family oxidoreductase [Ideonella livida]